MPSLIMNTLITLFHPSKLVESISNFRGVWLFVIIPVAKIPEFKAFKVPDLGPTLYAKIPCKGHLA